LHPHLNPLPQGGRGGKFVTFSLDWKGVNSGTILKTLSLGQGRGQGEGLLLENLMNSTF